MYIYINTSNEQVVSKNIEKYLDYKINSVKKMFDIGKG